MNNKFRVEFTVNGEKYERYVDPGESLAEVIRDKLGITGTKVACDRGDCGACTVIMNGKAVKSCIVPALRADGAEITTIEGLGKEKIHPIQEEFVDIAAVQCG